MGQCLVETWAHGPLQSGYIFKNRSLILPLCKSLSFKSKILSLGQLFSGDMGPCCLAAFTRTLLSFLH
jgi:hypothetical protein